MVRVLVVDDEPRYRDHISRVLTRDGHEVRVAGSAREAIASGSAFRPHVLVADWMLRDQLHGLQVCESLSTAVPGLKTILITGFPSADVRADARSVQVVEFIEKPFEMARLRDAVRAAAAAGPTPLGNSPIAVLDVRRDGVIRFANERARQLLAQTTSGVAATDLGQILELGANTPLGRATERWVPVAPRGPAPLRWQVRAKAHVGESGWLVVIVPDEQRHLQEHPVVRMLLDLEASPATPWPFGGRTLIVDDDQWVRHIVARQIENGGGICHTAESAQAALQTCLRDSGIEIVVIDHDLPGEKAGELVAGIRQHLPQVRFVGTSGLDRAEEFRQMGVTAFLLKPWAMADLIAVLRQQIGRCATCDLPLPLRHPQAREEADQWVCVRCGRHYQAVLDENATMESRRNVVPLRGVEAGARVPEEDSE